MIDSIENISFSIFEIFSDINPLVPCYHVVSDDILPYVRHLYQYKNVNQFIKDMDFFARHFSPISLDDLMDYFKQGKEISKRSIIFTFDDGYKECYSVIAPILYKKGIPAIFFVCSDLVDNRKMHYRNKASLLVDLIIKDETKVKILKSAIDYFAKMSTNEIVNHILTIGYKDQNGLDYMAEKIGLDFLEFLNYHQPYLTKLQIASMIKMGFYFGSHSKDHANYEDLTLKEQLDQTVESTEFIKENFGLKYSIFAFPFGDKNISLKFFNSISKHIDLTFGLNGILKDVAPFNVQRILFDNVKVSAKRIYRKQLIRKFFYKIKGKNILKRI